MKITLENGNKLEIAIKDKSGKENKELTKTLILTLQTSLLHAANFCTMQGWYESANDYEARYDQLNNLI